MENDKIEITREEYEALKRGPVVNETWVRKLPITGNYRFKEVMGGDHHAGGSMGFVLEAEFERVVRVVYTDGTTGPEYTKYDWSTATKEECDNFLKQRLHETNTH